MPLLVGSIKACTMPTIVSALCTPRTLLAKGGRYLAIIMTAGDFSMAYEAESCSNGNNDQVHTQDATAPQDSALRSA